MDLTHPIARGKTLKARGCSFWTPFNYEKLPKICFYCGCIVHGVNRCSSGQDNHDRKKEQYDFWLRAKQFQKTKSYSGGTWRKEEGNRGRRKEKSDIMEGVVERKRGRMRQGDMGVVVQKVRIEMKEGEDEQGKN